MELFEEIAKLRAEQAYDRIIELMPYARLLGIQFEERNGKLLFLLPAAEKNIGNITLPALHGGVIGGFMEIAGIIHLMWAMENTRMPKTIDFSIDYLRSGRVEDLYAECMISRQGKRVAHVNVDAWQAERDKPVALARAHFLLA